MYSLEAISNDREEFQKAVLNARAYKTIYVKFKVFYGCNLKCEICNHLREAREPPVSAARFNEVITELAGLGTKKIHISGVEPMRRTQYPEFVDIAASPDIKVSNTSK